MSTVVRAALLTSCSFMLSCAQETYTCCVEGLVETCECPRGTNCLVPTVVDHGDGTCDSVDTGDSASGG